jgi:ABC-type multidrug transport system fused ATPase/permease subunit
MLKLFNTFFGLLNARKRFAFWSLLAVMVFYAVIEVATVAALSAYISLLVDFDGFSNSSFFQKAVEQFSLLEGSQNHVVLLLSAAVLFVILLKNVLKMLLVFRVSKYASFISVDVGKYLITGFLHMPYEWHMKQKLSDLVLVTQWLSQVSTMMSSFLHIISDIILAAIMLVIVVYLNSFSSIFVVFLIALIGYVIFVFVKKRVDVNATAMKDSSLEIHRSTSRAAYGYREMKIYDMEREATDEYMTSAIRYANGNVWKDFYVPLPAVLLESIGIAILVAFVVFAVVYQEQSGAQVAGELTVFVLIMWRTMPAVSRILSNFTKFRKVFPFVTTVADYVKQVSKSIDVRSGLSESKIKLNLDTGVDIKQLVFNYSGSETPAIDQVGFSLNKGESIGVVGLSGSGKSTLADLLVGLLEPKDGLLLTEGQELSLAGKRIHIDKLSYVSQSPFFFDATLAENIAFSIDRNDIDYERLAYSCEMAALSDILDTLPNGLDTLIGEKGVRLSGGQLQRVSIARALYRNPDIILFDESTSALDLKSERAIQQTINQLSGNISLVIIAHRLETVEKCDRMVWIDKGQVMESGRTEVVLPKYKKSLN